MQGLDSYESPTKETWRNWQWNRIVERLPEFLRVHSFSGKQGRFAASTKTVVYLAGAGDSDRECAIKRGFRNDNLIAIDIQQKNIDSIRRAGGYGISGYLEDVIFCWPNEWHIDAIIADTCSGISAGSFDLLKSIVQSRGTDANTIVAFNGFRGRDQFGNPFRAEMKANAKHRDGCYERASTGKVNQFLTSQSQQMAPDAWKALQLYGDVAGDSVHRGKQFLYMWWLLTQDLLKDAGRECEIDLTRIAHASRADFYSYESLGNSYAKMDSSVFRCGFSMSWENPKAIKTAWDYRQQHGISRKHKFNPRKMVQKIAALRAVITKAAVREATQPAEVANAK